MNKSYAIADSSDNAGPWPLLVCLAVFAAAATPMFGQGSCASPANPIVAENCLPGTPESEWMVTGAGDASIQGFATEFSINKGQTVFFKVKTPATDYRLEVYRIGYYAGNGARLVATV
jgi:hypothetical protein